MRRFVICLLMTVGCGDEFADSLAKPTGSSLRVADTSTGVGHLQLEDCEGVGCATTDIRTIAPHAGWGRWLSGSSIAIEPGDREALIADVDNRALLRIDLGVKAAPSPTQIQTVGLDAEPEQVVIGPDGRAWVSLRTADSVALVEGGQVTFTVKTGREPYGLALSPGFRRLYVTHVGSRTVVALDTESLEIVWSLDLDSDPRGLTVSPSGRRLHIAHAAPGQVTVVTLPDRGAPGELSKYVRALADHPATPLVTSNPKKLSPSRAMAAVVSPSGQRVFVPHVVCDERAPGSGRSPLAYYGDAQRPAIKPLLSVFVPGQGLSRWSTRTAAEQGDFDMFDLIADRTFPMVDRANLPAAAAHHPTKSLLFVAMHGTDNILAYGTAGPGATFATLGITAVSPGPKGLAISQDGKRLFVHSEFARRLDVLDIGQISSGLGSTMPYLHSLKLGASERSEYWIEGRRLFHSAGSSSIVAGRHVACAGCHIDGRTDRLVWSFAPGRRNAPQLAGRLEGTSPYNWGGDMEGLGANVARSVVRMGGSGLTGFQRAALTLYIRDGLNPPRNPWPDRLPASLVERGREIFESPEAACATCHMGDMLTDSRRHELSRLGGLYDTPSLKDVWATAPYFHDGRYPTLRDVVVKGGVTMGQTAHLTDDDVIALVAYLKTL